jgi:ATP-dependent protease ClpP protease subunit
VPPGEAAVAAARLLADGAGSAGSVSRKSNPEKKVDLFVAVVAIMKPVPTFEKPQSDMSTVYVNFFSQINDVSANKFMAACAEIIRVDKPQRLHFLFASAGGSVDAGIAIYNYLRALPVEIIMHNTGAIDSIANVIFHAADERHATPHSTFLFHGVAMNLEKSTLNRFQLQELLSQLSALETKIADILVGRCQLTQLVRWSFPSSFWRSNKKRLFN